MYGNVQSGGSPKQFLENDYSQFDRAFRAFIRVTLALSCIAVVDNGVEMR